MYKNLLLVTGQAAWNSWDSKGRWAYEKKGDFRNYIKILSL